MEPQKPPTNYQIINNNRSKSDPRAQGVPFGGPGAHFGRPGTIWELKTVILGPLGDNFAYLFSNFCENVFD